VGWQGGSRVAAKWLQRCRLKLIPEPQSRDSREIPVIGDENRSCFEGMGADPDVVDWKGISGLSE